MSDLDKTLAQQIRKLTAEDIQEAAERDSTTRFLRSLVNEDLSLENTMINRPVFKGPNPYDSGTIAKPRKKDLPFDFSLDDD